MLPPKSRGQLLVYLANSNLNSIEPDNPDRALNIHAELNDSTNANVDPYIEIPNSTCSDVINSISPIIEIINNSDVNIAQESGDVDMIPDNCLTNSIDILFLNYEEQVEASADILNCADQDRSIIEDPDFIPEANDDDSDEQTSKNNGRPKKGRKRKYEDQNSSIRKKKANTNQDYFSAKGKKVCAKEFNSSDCNCPLKCTEKIGIEQRKKEFDKFWNSGSYEARCALLQGSITETKTRRSYVRNSKRTFTRKYKLCDTSVCKKAFLITLGISQSRIDVALNKYREQAFITDKRGVKSGGKNAISEEQLKQIKDFIQSLPKYSSHYCKDSTSAIFLAPNLNLTIIYDLYKEKYENPVMSVFMTRGG